MYDNANTQEWRRHDRAVAVIVALIVIVFSALGVYLAVATSYRWM